MATAIKIKCLPEPELQFGNGQRDIDPRRALAENGPADHRGMRSIRLGLVGLADEVSAAWKFITPIHEAWAAAPAPEFPNYPAGTWGPAESAALIGRDGRSWRRL